MAQVLAAGWHYKSDEQLNEIGLKVGRDRIMVLHGSGDRMLTLPHGEILMKGLGAKRSAVREGMGHVLMMEDLEWFHGMLEEHLRETVKLGKE